MITQQVKIGPEFFAKIKHDYADWRWALVREFLQNCFDAPGCKNVAVNCTTDGVTTSLTVSNDGAPMDRSTLENKLLTLGGSGKNFEGDNTGGFGVAKSLLYYCHGGYVISTGNLMVRGAGAQYTISEQATSPGTTSIISIDGDEAEALVAMFRRFAGFAQWRGTLTVNGEVVETAMRKGARRRQLPFGTVYTNNSWSNVCVVRLNGQPMHTRYTRFKGCVVVELDGKADDVLTSNRDSLTSDYASQLGDFLTSLSIDKKSALREQRAEYKRYAGEVQRNQAKAPKLGDGGLAAVVDVGAIAALVSSGELGGGARTEATPETAHGGIKLVVESRQDEPDATVSVGPQFILKNAIGMKTPTYYTPGEGFTRYSRELVRSWTGLLLKLHQVCNRSGEFSVGFVLDEESGAESEKSGAYGQVYYINPVRVVSDSNRRRMEARFGSAWADRHQLISVACHEFVHGAYGLGEHDEDYASRLTEVTAVAMRHLSELEALCRPVKSEVELDAVAEANPFRRYNQQDCMGHSATSVVRWMARAGFTFASIRDTMSDLGCALTDNTVRSSIQVAKQADAKVADLTDEQELEVRRLGNRYS